LPHAIRSGELKKEKKKEKKKENERKRSYGRFLWTTGVVVSSTGYLRCHPTTVLGAILAIWRRRVSSCV
jgi:hypothetical protein